MIDNKELAKQLSLPEGENSKIVTEFMAKGNRSLYEFTFDQINFLPSAQVLEIGPANGHFLNEIFKRNSSINYTGLDLSHDMIEAAVILNSKLIKSKKAKFLQGDVIALPFNNENFDFIITLNTLYFWTDLRKGMDEIKRVLKPNGKIVIAIRSKETMVKMPFTEFGFQLFTKQELKSVLTSNGFNNVEISTKTENITLPSGENVNTESFCAIAEKE